MTYRAAPLTTKEQELIRSQYKKGDAFRDAHALGERFNVSPEDIIAVVSYRYSKGGKKSGK